MPKYFLPFIFVFIIFALSVSHLQAQRNTPEESSAKAVIKKGNADSLTELSAKIGKNLKSFCIKFIDWKEEGLSSEKGYLKAMARWLANLRPFQRERAWQILQEAEPVVRVLRQAIRDKKSELAELSFDHNTSPFTLPRLGLELQELRSSLKQKFEMLSDRLFFEAGVKVGPIGEDGFWLIPFSWGASSSRRLSSSLF